MFRLKNHKKMALTSDVSDTSMQSLDMRLGLCHREFIRDTPVRKGQRGVTMATNFGTKIAINAYKCISTRDDETLTTYNRVFLWSTNPQKTSLIARV